VNDAYTDLLMSALEAHACGNKARWTPAMAAEYSDILKAVPDDKLYDLQSRIRHFDGPVSPQVWTMWCSSHMRRAPRPPAAPEPERTPDYWRVMVEGYNRAITSFVDPPYLLVAACARLEEKSGTESRVNRDRLARLFPNGAPKPIVTEVAGFNGIAAVDPFALEGEAGYSNG
jgi:hypothetical protein